MHAGIRVIDENRLWKSIFLFLTAIFIFGASIAWSSAELVGHADVIKGDASIEREGQRSSLKQGDPVFLKDRLQTSAGSSAEVVFLDESRVKMAESTSLEITEFVYDLAERTRLGLIALISGKARFAVRDLPEFFDKRFRVQTKTALIASRDTDFIVVIRSEEAKDSVCKGGLVEALCVENEIVVFSRDFADNPVLITPNMISQICGRNLPTPPRFATQGERTSILTGLEQIGNVITPLSGSPRVTSGHAPAQDQ